MADGLSWQSHDGALALSGCLDRETLLPLWRQRDALLAQADALDLSGVQRVDSAGLALLVHFYAQRQQQGRELRVTGVSDRLKTLIDLYNLNEIMPIQLAG